MECQLSFEAFTAVTKVSRVQEFTVRTGENEDIVLQLGDWVWEDTDAAADVYRQVTLTELYRLSRAVTPHNNIPVRVFGRPGAIQASSTPA